MLAPSEKKNYDSKYRFCEELEKVFDNFLKYHMKILLGDFNAKVGRENIFKLTIGNESLHQDSNDDGIRNSKLATSKNLVVKSMMFPHQNISRPGPLLMGTLNQVDRILIGRRWHSSILDIRIVRRADCDTDHYLVVAKVRERLAVSIQTARKCDGERFNLRRLNELEVRKRYRSEISNRFAALENLFDGQDINRASENIKENIKTSTKENLGLHELKQHRPWFDKESVGFLDQRKQATIQWVQDPRQSNVDNLNTVRHKASRHFRNKKKAYLKAKSRNLKITVR